MLITNYKYYTDGPLNSRVRRRLDHTNKPHHKQYRQPTKTSKKFCRLKRKPTY